MKRYINLLPPEHQKNIRLARLNSQIFSFGIWSVLSLLIFSTILFAALIVFRQQLETMKQEVASQSKILDEIKQTSVQKEVEKYNRDLKNFEVLVGSSEKWSAVIKEIAENLPKDLTVDSLSINRADHKIDITGRAGSRDAVLTYRQNILNSEIFTNINFPLANLEKARDVNWKYRFFVKPELLK